MKSATKYLFLNVLLGGCFVVGNRESRAEDRMQESLPPPAATSPLESHSPEDVCPTMPHRGNINLYDGAPIVGDGINISNVAMQASDVPFQHPAPEVVLRFSKSCSDVGPNDWSLSSRDVPRSVSAIPHGPLTIELRTEFEPVAFVELMFDGRPLNPTDYATVGPLRYELPCPAAGQHWLQAKYSSGNLWSYYSSALRFEVRLPNQPRIIAASDSDRDPTPLTRQSLTSITTGSIKIHLANVDRGDSIVAYVDGKPVSTHLVGEPCCRIIPVEGSVTPGVHKLTVRTVGCPGSCSITSQPSNTVMFHYYDEGVYLLRPGANCKNDNSAVRSSCTPTANSAANIIRPYSRAVMRSGEASGNSVSNSTAEYTFVNLLLADPNPKVEAAQLLDDAQKFRDMTAADAATVKVSTDAVANHASATSAAATIAERARDNALAARAQAERDAVATDGFAMQTGKLKDGELASYKHDAQTANALAQAARANAQLAYPKIDETAKSARSRADTCQSHLDAAVKAHAAASELLRIANEALAKAQVFANEARLAQDVNGNAEAAEQARKKIEAELGRIQNVQQAVAILVAPIEGQQQAAAEQRRLADADLAQAQRQLQVIRTEAKTVGDQSRLARVNYEAASALAVHLRNPSYLLARSHADAAQASHEEAAGATQRAIDQAAAAKEMADRAKSVAETAHARSVDATDAIRRTSDAEREALSAARRADAAVRQADIEAAKFPSNSLQGNVAHRAAAAARAERDAAYMAATEARTAYYAAHTHSTGVAAAANDADQHANTSLARATDAQQHAQAAATALNLAMQARGRAEQAAAQLLEALKNGNNVAVVTANSTQTASAAKMEAERQTLEAKRQEADAITHATAAANNSRLAVAAGDRASLVAKSESQATNAKADAINRANSADRSAALAGLSLKLQSDLKDAWDNAEVTAMQDELLKRVAKASASPTGGDVDVQRAEDGASVAELLAARAEARSAARVREYDANARTARANNVNAPPSPFYFASAAHFPIREFGLRGESLDRDGVVIYEDMALHFDRDGNYEVHFRASAPEMPATIQLQFQIQPNPDRPWYTITLAPVEFPYPHAQDEKTKSLKGSCSGDQDSKECCGEVRDCVCKGHSEILRRCYGEMGQEARIRRSGTARFGFGINMP